MRHHHNASGLECNETQHVHVYAPASPDNKDKTKMKLTQT